MDQTVSQMPPADYNLPTDGDTAICIEDSLEHMPEQLIERDPVTLFDESKKF